MKAVHVVVLGIATLVGGSGLSPVSAQTPATRTVDQFKCKDMMRESGSDRDVAIAFLHGYLMGKSGGTSINLDVLHKQSAEFIERCLDNPGEKAVDVMAKIKG